MHLRELLKVDSADVLNLFYAGLKERTARQETISDAETMYVASILASYAQTSRYDPEFFPPFSSLSTVFDVFVVGCNGLRDPALLEIAGSQIILLAGFFRGQMRRRHNIDWYDGLGCAFYHKASIFSRNPKQAVIFKRMSRNFPTLTLACWQMSQDFERDRLLLRLRPD